MTAIIIIFRVKTATADGRAGGLVWFSRRAQPTTCTRIRDFPRRPPRIARSHERAWRYRRPGGFFFVCDALVDRSATTNRQDRRLFYMLLSCTRRCRRRRPPFRTGVERCLCFFFRSPALVREEGPRVRATPAPGNLRRVDWNVSSRRWSCCRTREKSD